MILTFTGRLVDPLRLEPEDISILDIAHSLSMQCRFTGHSRRFYSVAEHCVRVSNMVPERFALWGLLHDATEAYLGDVSRPLKQTTTMARYREAEARASRAVALKFNLLPNEPHEVKAADWEACRQEGISLVKGWTTYPQERLFPPIKCLPPEEAKSCFLSRFDTLAKVGYTSAQNNSPNVGNPARNEAA